MLQHSAIGFCHRDVSVLVYCCSDQAADYELTAGRSPEFVNFLARLLSPNVDTRYSAEQALKDPWMASVDGLSDKDQATWSCLLERGLKSYDRSAETVQPTNYVDFAAWQEQVRKVIGEEEIEEGTPDEDDAF